MLLADPDVTSFIESVMKLFKSRNNTPAMYSKVGAKIMVTASYCTGISPE